MSRIDYQTASQKYGAGFWANDHTWQLETGERIDVNTGGKINAETNILQADKLSSSKQACRFNETQKPSAFGIFGSYINDDAGNSDELLIQSKNETSISPENAQKKSILESVFQNTMKEIHLGNSTNPQVLKIEKEMKKLGVQVTFEDDLETGQEILNVCKKLKSQGIELPKEVILMTPQNASTHGFTPLMRPGYEKDAQIFIQKGLGSKTQLSDPMFKSIGLKHFSDDTPAGTFTHELGHWHHDQNLLDDSQAQQIWSSYVNNDNEMSIAQKVSAHAMTDNTGKEFTAEVFAGICKGEKYDDEVMNLYSKLNGPKVNIKP